MPQGKNEPHRDLPSRSTRREPTKPNPQSLTSRERKKIAKLMRHLPGGSGRRIAETARHKQGESNRGKDLMSDAERAQILRNTQSQQPKKVKQRKGVVVSPRRRVRGEQSGMKVPRWGTKLAGTNKKRK